MQLFMQHAILVMFVLRTGRVKLDQFLDIMEVSLCRDSTKHCFKGLHKNIYTPRKSEKITREKPLFGHLPNMFLSVNIPFSFYAKIYFQEHNVDISPEEQLGMLTYSRQFTLYCTFITVHNKCYITK
jgi:hypothetical protein